MCGRFGPINVISPKRVIFVVFRWIRLRAPRMMSRPPLAPTLLLLWGVFIVYATMLPFDFTATGELIRSRVHRLWERPLRGSGGSWHDVYSNILLFMPWGFLLAIWRAGRSSSWLAAVAWALLSGACLSGFVEFVQVFAPERYTSFLDLATNTLGSVVGAVIGWPLSRWIWPIASVRIRRLLLSRPVAACALAVMVGLLVADLSPTYVRHEEHATAAKLKRVQLIPFGLLSGERPLEAALRFSAETLTWTLIGGLLVLAARESGRDGVRAVGSAVALAGCLSLALEVTQLVVPGRVVDGTSVALAVVGSALGAITVTQSAKRDPRRWITPGLAVWCVATLLAAWSPLRFAWPDPPFWRTEMLVPFWSYFGSRNLEDLTDVVGQAMVFLPLGALLAAQSWRQTFLGTILIGFGLGLLLESGQVFLPDRSADMSDAISAATGAGLGLALWRWGEFARNSSMGVTRYRVGRRAGR
jgi:glycopeptide antibiotics resistance protein